MGWSCRADAHDTMTKWTAACVAATGSQNEFVVNGKRFMWELSRKEHEDGAITGSILEVIPSTSPDGSFLAYRRGTFRINGDGTVARAPAFLKALGPKLD